VRASSCADDVLLRAGAALARGGEATVRRFFVTGTDTGVGKTQVSCALLRGLAARGLRPHAFKPMESGVAARAAPADAAALQEAGGGFQPLDTVCLYRFEAPVAPGVAAARERRKVDFARVVRSARALGPGALVVEGAGGLFVPLTRSHDVVDLIAQLKLPVVLVARLGLGTLNHTALSLEALARRRLTVAAVVLVKATAGEDTSEADNPRWLRARHPGVRFLGPVPFEADASRRAAAFSRAVKPLLG
jgi:dethiobiotin synthetase